MIIKNSSDFLLKLFLCTIVLKSESCNKTAETPKKEGQSLGSTTSSRDRSSTGLSQEDPQRQPAPNQQNSQNPTNPPKAKFEKVSDRDWKNTEILVLPFHGKDASNKSFEGVVKALKEILGDKVKDIRLCDNYIELNRSGDLCNKSIVEQVNELTPQYEACIDNFIKGKDPKNVVIMHMSSSQGAQLYFEWYKNKYAKKYQNLNCADVIINGCVRGGKIIESAKKVDPYIGMLSSFLPGIQKEWEKNLSPKNQGVANLVPAESTKKMNEYVKKFKENQQNKVFSIATSDEDLRGNGLAFFSKVIFGSKDAISGIMPKVGLVPALNSEFTGLEKMFKSKKGDGMFLEDEQKLDENKQTLSKTISGKGFDHVVFSKNKDLISEISRSVKNEYLGIA